MQDQVIDVGLLVLIALCVALLLVCNVTGLWREQSAMAERDRWRGRVRELMRQDQHWN